jgi:hypothetical protein
MSASQFEVTIYCQEGHPSRGDITPDGRVITPPCRRCEEINLPKRPGWWALYREVKRAKKALHTRPEWLDG